MVIKEERFPELRQAGIPPHTTEALAVQPDLLYSKYFIE
jgi:hypothetical protein